MKPLHSLAIAALTLGLLTTTVSAQKLKLSVKQSAKTATVTVAGALPGLPIVLLLGLKEGKTQLYKGSNLVEALTIGLQAPFVPVPLGNADKRGTASKSYPLPPIKLPVKVLGQALSAAPKIKFGLPPKIVLGWLLSKIVRVL